MTIPPRRASPPPPLHRQVSTTVAPANRSDRPSVLARNSNTHVVFGIAEDEQPRPAYRAPGVNPVAASAPAATTSNPVTASAAVRPSGRRTARARRLVRSPSIASCDRLPFMTPDRKRVREAMQLTPERRSVTLRTVMEGAASDPRSVVEGLPVNPGETSALRRLAQSCEVRRVPRLRGLMGRCVALCGPRHPVDALRTGGRIARHVIDRLIAIAGKDSSRWGLAFATVRPWRRAPITDGGSEGRYRSEG